MSDTPYLVGQPVTISVVVTQNDPITGQPVLDGSGNPVRQDDASMACTVYKPDQSSLSPAPTVTRASVGAYWAQFTPGLTESGYWEYVFTGTTTAPGKGRGRLWVSPVP